MNLPKIPLVKIALIVLAMNMIGAIGGAYYFYTKYESAQKLLQNPTLAGQQEIEKYVAEIGSYILLPSDEKPTLATVSDTQKLKDQPFFAQSANGDKLLIYQNAKMAILYRPTIKKIVTVAYNVDSSGQAEAEPVATPVAVAKVASESANVLGEQKLITRIAFYNGTATPGLTNLAERNIKSKPSWTVVAKENAAVNTYERTQVVVLDPTQAEVAQQVALLFNGEMVTLPEGEAKPESDILVILGKDFLQP